MRSGGGGTYAAGSAADGKRCCGRSSGRTLRPVTGSSAFGSGRQRSAVPAIVTWYPPSLPSHCHTSCAAMRGRRLSSATRSSARASFFLGARAFGNAERSGLRNHFQKKPRSRYARSSGLLCMSDELVGSPSQSSACGCGTASATSRQSERSSATSGRPGLSTWSASQLMILASGRCAGLVK